MNVGNILQIPVIMIHFLAVGDRDYKQRKSEKQHNKNSADSVSIV